MVMPADGPSFGTAPAGTCTWMPFSSIVARSMFRFSATDQMYERAACTDSCITLPR